MYTLEILLPGSYPVISKPEAKLQCDPTLPIPERQAARDILSSVMSTLPTGVECLDLLAQSLLDQLSILKAQSSTAFSSSLDADADAESNTGSAPDTAVTLPRQMAATDEQTKRILIWTHHLLSTSKRKSILAWSRSLSLSGFSRPGYPGAIVVEGPVSSVDEFERLIKGMKWQALQVRAEETSQESLFVTAARTGEDGGGQAGHAGMQEVEELRDVVRGLEAFEERLGAWFLEGMRIGRS